MMLAKQRRHAAASQRACCSVKPSSTSASPIRRPVSSVGTDDAGRAVVVVVEPVELVAA